LGWASKGEKIIELNAPSYNRCALKMKALGGKMKLAKVEGWVEEIYDTNHPYLVSSVDWKHTKLVDHVNIPIGGDFVIGCDDASYITKSVWEWEEVGLFLRLRGTSKY
jgi:hypothetical protein